MMRIRLPLQAKVPTLLATTVILGLVALVVTGAATAAGRWKVQSEVSANWAGYAVTGKNYSRVSGTWREPTVKASSSSSDAYSAVWVGLGGYKTSASSFEQIGTTADYVGGHAQYYAWYELLPSGQMRLRIKIHAGDAFSARVSVSGTNVTVFLSDQTTGHSVLKTLHITSLTPRVPNVSSKHQLQRPSAATIRSLQLADFIKVDFSMAMATVGGYTGGISDPRWTPTRIQLRTQSTFGPA